MDVIFFPENRLNASFCNFYNGYDAAITLDTDTLQDGKYELSEINLFKHNLQATVFLSSLYYSDPIVLEALKKSRRINFGLYYHTDRWMKEGVYEVIPDYYEISWTALGASVFNVTEGAAKAYQYPNHGQELYDVSGGIYGYDAVNGSGSNNLMELNLSAEKQINDFPDLSLSSISYRNGKTQAAPFLENYFLGGRNSSYFITGDSFISYSGVTRNQAISRASNTRTWDQVRAGAFATEADGINYATGEISKAILNNGWWSDFMHWHDLYSNNDLGFFDRFFSAIDTAIGASDVWRAGYGEAVEYMFIRESVNQVGSFENNGSIYIYYQIKDKYSGLPIDLLNTPISIEIDTTGTALEGQNVKCVEADSVRNIGGNKWIINVPYRLDRAGFSGFKIAAGTQEYYNSSRPVITNTSGAITTDRECQFAVWRKSTGAGNETITEIDRVHTYTKDYNLTIESGYTYYVGAITEFNHSSLIEI